jgi:hypothetical protein
MLLHFALLQPFAPLLQPTVDNGRTFWEWLKEQNPSFEWHELDLKASQVYLSIITDIIADINFKW